MKDEEARKQARTILGMPRRKALEAISSLLQQVDALRKGKARVEDQLHEATFREDMGR